MNDYFWVLRSNLKRARKQAGLTQAQTAEKLKITARQYQRYESGTSSPSVYDLPNICEVLGISLEELFSVDTKPPCDARSPFEEMFNQLAPLEQTAIVQVMESMLKKKK